MISDDLLAMLVCPDCKTDLSYNQQAQTLKCGACGLVYPIRDGFPILLKDQAIKEQ